MKALHIDFSARRAARTSLLLWGLCLVGALFAIAGVTLGSILAERAGERVSQADEMLAQQASLSEAILHQEEVSPVVAVAANGAIRKLNYPLIEILTELERHATPEVRVVSVELGPIRTSLRLVVQATTIPRVLDYMDQIKKENDFRDVVLTHQEPVSSGDAQGMSRFTLEVAQQGAEMTPAGSNTAAEGESKS